MFALPLNKAAPPPYDPVAALAACMRVLESRHGCIDAHHLIDEGWTSAELIALAPLAHALNEKRRLAAREARLG